MCVGGGDGEAQALRVLTDLQASSKKALRGRGCTGARMRQSSEREPERWKVVRSARMSTSRLNFPPPASSHAPTLAGPIPSKQSSSRSTSTRIVSRTPCNAAPRNSDYVRERERESVCVCERERGGGEDLRGRERERQAGRQAGRHGDGDRGGETCSTWALWARAEPRARWKLQPSHRAGGGLEIALVISDSRKDAERLRLQLDQAVALLLH